MFALILSFNRARLLVFCFVDVDSADSISEDTVAQFYFHELWTFPKVASLVTTTSVVLEPQSVSAG